MFSFRNLVLPIGIILFPLILTVPLTGQDAYQAGDRAVISAIIIDGETIISPDSQHGIFKLSFRQNNIGFVFEGGDGHEFQVLLEGFDKKWSSWRMKGIKEYTNLPARSYTLKANTRTPDGIISEAEPFRFRIKPLWYFSKVAVALYITLFLLLIWALYEFLNLRFARKKHMLEQIINKRTEDLIIEKERSENLLANILPKNTVDEIMITGKATKIRYNFATVLFSDIQGFTQIAEEMNPEVLIDELDRFFFHFDSVVEKYRIEKIKTIGDAYMCAGGIPEKNRTNPVEVTLAALEMQDYMSKLKEKSKAEGIKYWDIRIGIHTGSVVAGVIGQKKLSYDIWGDTVNTASRMESSSEGGRVNISGTTYEFVKDFFMCDYRGKMPVKYKGELDMYFVNGIIPELAGEDGEPNSKFMLKLQIIKIRDIEDLIVKLYDEEAPPNLYFHNTDLVRSIINQAELLATAEQLPEEETVVLKLASIFLLSGYVYDYDQPAEASLLFMEKILPSR
ncbi:MAG TPA: adenylate/guanylate cyclase domain-containing protein, partial [Bacteroidales bacterium]|nr:adenylate/guanylate cyclase domain-containing protein [Bacteroidales bacterium]